MDVFKYRINQEINEIHTENEDQRRKVESTAIEKHANMGPRKNCTASEKGLGEEQEIRAEPEDNLRVLEEKKSHVRFNNGHVDVLCGRIRVIIL